MDLIYEKLLSRLNLEDCTSWRVGIKIKSSRHGNISGCSVIESGQSSYRPQPRARSEDTALILPVTVEVGRKRPVRAHPQVKTASSADRPEAGGGSENGRAF